MIIIMIAIITIMMIMRMTPLVASVIITTTVTIPMTMSWASICHAQMKNGVEVQQLWCNSDIYHFDLSYWAFEQLAHPTYGVMMVDFRYGTKRHSWLAERQSEGTKRHLWFAGRQSEGHQKALLVCWKAQWRAPKGTCNLLKGRVKGKHVALKVLLSNDRGGVASHMFGPLEFRNICLILD